MTRSMTLASSCAGISAAKRRRRGAVSGGLGRRRKAAPPRTVRYAPIAATATASGKMASPSAVLPTLLPVLEPRQGRFGVVARIDRRHERGHPRREGVDGEQPLHQPAAGTAESSALRRMVEEIGDRAS